MILGLAGAARSGKDTVAKFIQMSLRTEGIFEVRQLSFAAPIKEMVQTLLSMQPEVLEELKDKDIAFECGRISPRHMMQTLGTEWGRKQLHEDFWISMLRERMGIYSAMQPNTHYIITDVRFPNEAQAIQRWGGEVWEVYRPDGPEIETPIHESESGLPRELSTHTVMNTRDLGYLRQLVSTQVSSLLLPQWRLQA